MEPWSWRFNRCAQALRWLPFTLSLTGCAATVPSLRLGVSVEPWSEQGLNGRRLVTEHFEIISTLHDAEFEAALPGFLEAAYKRYYATLPLPARPNAKLTTHVFATRSEWLRYVQRRFPARYDIYARIWSGGFTEGDTSVSFYVDRSATLATLAHEGWHQYVGSRLEAAIPAWLNEGLACYHEAVEFTSTEPKFAPQHNTFRVNALRKALQTDKLMALAEIVATDAGPVIRRHDRRIANLYYAQAWALVTFLRHGASGRFSGAFDTMLSDIADGTLGIKVSATRLGASNGASLSLGEAAFRAYFGFPPDDLEDQYYDHLVRICRF